MIDLADELERVTAVFEAADVEYALVGGLALAAHGHARATRDIDLAVSQASLNAAVAALQSIGYRSHSGNVKLGRGKLEMRRLNRFEAQDFVVVDLLIPLDPSLDLVLETRQRSDGKPPWIASRDGLRTLKQLRGSLQDLADIAALDGTEE